MKLTHKTREFLVNEIRFALAGMRSAESFQEKNYYYSAVYATSNRVLNLEFDSELLLIHQVTNTTYTTLQNAIKLTRDGEMIPTITPELYKLLTDQIEELANEIEDDKPTYETLQNITVLAYATTGNGHYLSLKGKLKL